MSVRSALALWVGAWIANALLAALSMALLRAGMAGDAWRPVVALLPALPVAFALVVFVARIPRMDELRQRITVGSFAMASAVVGILVYGWSLLQWAGAPAIPAIWVLPAQLLLWGALMLALRWRYP